MIDLHTHSDESDGSWPPQRLVDEALRLPLDALAITDHDTLSGYDHAAPLARAAGLDLVCAIELSTKLVRKDKPQARNVHLLGYFLDGPPAGEFRDWLGGIQASRLDRNQRLAAKLQSLGLEVTIEEAQALGRNLTGRPHFAKVMVGKGYVATIQEAFDKFLDEFGQAYVQRREPSLAEAVQQIDAAGGLAVLAHPCRLTRSKPARLDGLVKDMVEEGLRGIEAYHSDHSPADVERLLGLAAVYGLAVTGGSDFHGDAKPNVALGRGHDGTLSVPREVLDRLRELRGQRSART
jgi:predicted metal-dependent phosphoesterase TrpH